MNDDAGFFTAPVVICNKCNEQVLLDQLEDHEQKLCSSIRQQCICCELQFSFLEMSEHLKGHILQLQNQLRERDSQVPDQTQQEGRSAPPAAPTLTEEAPTGNAGQRNGQFSWWTPPTQQSTVNSALQRGGTQKYPYSPVNVSSI
jgi:hypothetical protein